jgi:phosphoglycerol geranylgeranyltransferase
MKSTPFRDGEKKVAVLIDPDNYNEEGIRDIALRATSSGADFLFTGGSLTHTSVDAVIKRLKELTTIPVVLFPGSLLQLTTEADIILLLSMISGRNPELLIGNHVIAAPYLRNYREKVLSVGYILISCGPVTSVEYMSQCAAIPYEKTEIAVATALAGEMLGMKAIYLEGGSGAEKPVSTKTIKAVRHEITIPLITGGGLRSSADIEKAFDAGADVIVIGNGCEGNPGLINDACRVRDSLNLKI